MTISNNFKMLFLGLSFFSFISCSNDKASIGTSSEAIIKVELINTANFTDFDESLVVQIVAYNANEINVIGATWDNIENHDNLARQFIRYGAISAQSRTFVTSKKVKALTIAFGTIPKVYDDSKIQKMNTTINVYADDKLIKTEVFSSSYNTINNFILPIAIEK